MTDVTAHVVRPRDRVVIGAEEQTWRLQSDSSLKGAEMNGSVQIINQLGTDGGLGPGPTQWRQEGRESRDRAPQKTLRICRLAQDLPL